MLESPTAGQTLPRQELQKWLRAISRSMGIALCLRGPEGEVLARHGEGEECAATEGVQVSGTGLRLCTSCEQGKERLGEAAALLETIFAEIGGYEAEMESMSQELLARYEEVNLFYELADELASIFEMEDIARFVLNKSQEILDADGAWIFLPNEKEPLSLYAEQLRDVHLSPEMKATLQRLASRCRDEGVHLLIEGMEDIVRLEAEEMRLIALEHVQPVTALVLPVQVQEKFLGVLLVARFDQERPYNGQDLRLASALGSMLAMGMYNSQLVQKAKQEELARKELEIASMVQKSLLPIMLPQIEGVDLASEYIAANKVGGDYLDYMLDRDGRLYLVVADVSGHNIGAALLMASSRIVFRTQIAAAHGPREILEAANHILYPDFDRSELFLSAVVARYDGSTRELEISSAGHNPALLWRAAESKIEWLQSDGFFIGLDPDLELAQRRLKLAPGDVLLLYTDGLVEAANELGERYETDRLEAIFRQLVSQPARTILDGIAADVQAFMKRKHFADDISVIVLKVVEP